MRKTTLSSNWLFSRRGETPPHRQTQVGYLNWRPANVPGAVELDLESAGVTGNPFARAVEAGLRWVEDAAWLYRCEFEWHADGDLTRRVLRFQGLDTVCTVSLNGQVIASQDNAFLPLEIDVTERLVEGQNTIVVEFESSVGVALERREAYFEGEGINHDPPMFDERAFVRKPGYMSGWDWGPRLVSRGIWGPVSLLEFNSRITGASFLQEKLPDGRFKVRVEATVDGNELPGAEFNGLRREPGEPLEFIVEDPVLWWPNNEGEQHLYEGRVFLLSGHEIRKKIGLRTIRFVQEEDRFGRSFEFEVNGRRIWSRGANWIPNDSFVARDDPEAVDRQIEVCRRLNMNMLRVWGGGYYESEAFYDACDRHGILVWQDFPYACSYYPDGDAAQAVAFKEAAHHVRRLRDRASLALWCGNNENLAMWESGWGGMELRPKRYYGENLYDISLPEAVKANDPNTSYIPTSPLLPTDESNSDAHYWDVWHGRGDWKYYLESRTRFSSEFGFASSCSMACWDTVLAPEDYHPRSLVVRWHDKTNKPVETFEGYVHAHYPEYETLEDWIYYSQLNQRDALHCGIEHYRRSEFCRGALIWQFNDCWPVQSWAVQDYSRLIKPAGHELNRLYAPLLISFEVEEEAVKVHVVNDGPEPFRGVLDIEALSALTGAALCSWSVQVEVAAGARMVVHTVPIDAPIQNGSVLKASLAGHRETTTWTLLCEPRKLCRGNAVIRAEIGSQITLSVEGFVCDLVVWDPEDAHNLYDLSNGQPGWKAMTLANESVAIGIQHRPVTLSARSLAGYHTIELVNPTQALVGAHARNGSD